MKKHLNICPACGSSLEISKYTCPSCGTSCEGHFTGCPFCKLSDDDRLFALVFIQTEGNMRDVERVMGISYPTIKSRLAKLINSLSADSPVEMNVKTQNEPSRIENTPDTSERAIILDRLSSGEISASEAGRLLRGNISDK